MSHYVQLVVGIDGYETENRERIEKAVADILDWTDVELGDRDGVLKYEGELSFGELDDGDESVAHRIHRVIGVANNSGDVRTTFWFYDLEAPFKTVALGPDGDDDNTAGAID